MAQTPLAETIVVQNNDAMLFALQVVATLFRCERGQVGWGVKFDDLLKEAGIGEQRLMAGLHFLQEKQIVEVRTVQESTSGPYVFRVRRIKDFQIQIIPPA